MDLNERCAECSLGRVSHADPMVDHSFVPPRGAPKPLRVPRCYGCHERPAAKGHRFCTKTCAAAWAEELSAGNCDGWCPVCREWTVKGSQYSTLADGTKVVGLCRECGGEHVPESDGSRPL